MNWRFSENPATWIAVIATIVGSVLAAVGVDAQFIALVPLISGAITRLFVTPDGKPLDENEEE